MLKDQDLGYKEGEEVYQEEEEAHDEYVEAVKEYQNSEQEDLPSKKKKKKKKKKSKKSKKVEDLESQSETPSGLEEEQILTERGENGTPQSNLTSIVSQLSSSLGKITVNAGYKLPVDEDSDNDKFEPNLPDLPPLPQEETKEEEKARYNNFEDQFGNM